MGVNNESDVVREYEPLVKKIAGIIAVRVPASVRFEDLMQDGFIGLLEAYKNYDSKQDASFETYAGIRIRGAMLDGLRKQDYRPRSVGRNKRKMRDAASAVGQRTGREATPEKVAEELQISVEDLENMRSSGSGGIALFSELSDSSDPSKPFDILETSPDYSMAAQIRLMDAEYQDFLNNATRLILNPRDYAMFSLVYDDEVTLREIGEIYGFSESRASQIMDDIAAKIAWAFDHEKTVLSHAKKEAGEA